MCVIERSGLLLLFLELIISTSRTSTLWRLNADERIVDESRDFPSRALQYEVIDDTVFHIITSTVHRAGDVWMKLDNGYNTYNMTKPASLMKEIDQVLDCGKSVNFTYYDNLVGILNRSRHPKIPESQAILVFHKYRKMTKSGDGDIAALEKRLRRARKEKPKSVQLYNQLGNYWHFKGDTQKSIECFRRALAAAPHSADVLLNLARVLFTLQYLDDAIYLTRRSLEVQPPDKGAWQQYFTLGEIFKTYGHYQDAAVHLKHTLELKPDFELAQIALTEMESLPTNSVHIYTLVIIMFLVLGVLLVILTNGEPFSEHDVHVKTHRQHFNKAMAMKTLRGFTIKHRQRPK